MLNQFSSSHIKNKKVRTIIEFLLILLLLAVFWMVMESRYVEQSNEELSSLTAQYIDTINAHDFSALSALYYPADKIGNDSFISYLKARSDSISFQKMELLDIYPALINQDLAVLAYHAKTTNLYKGYESSIQEINLLTFMRHGKKWYIARPEHIFQEYDERYVLDFLDEYGNVLTKYMPAYVNQKEYNKKSFEQFKENMKKQFVHDHENFVLDAK